MRKDLGGGHWVDLVDRMTWAQRNRIRDAASGDNDFFSGFATTLCRTLVMAWDVPDGLPLSDEGWDRLDADTGDAIFAAALGLWKGTADPKDMLTTPSDSPPA